MIRIKEIADRVMLLLLVAGLTACATVIKESQEDVAGNQQYPILDVLPKRIEGFTYEGMREYPPPWGYSLRFRNEPNNAVYADIYLYPVPQELSGHEQDDIVMIKTDEALEEIDYFYKAGSYSEFEIINRDSFQILGETASRVEIYLVKDNLALYSLLFVTEKDGKLVKVRMTMPNNQANTSNDAWGQFVNEVFTVILNNIEKA
jgi:hypothetical protein